MPRIKMQIEPGGDLPNSEVRGRFAYRGDYARMVFTCPRRHGLCGVPFAPNKLANGATWRWDGNRLEPTVTPSINCTGGCKWHGFITNGWMTSDEE